MIEGELNLSEKSRKQLTEDMINKADRIIVMAETDTLPEYIKDNKKIIFWEVENPKGKSLEGHRQCRDQVKELVKSLVDEIK